MRGYTVVFWRACCASVTERHATRRAAAAAIAEFIRDQLESLPRLRPALERQGSAYRDGCVTVKHKSGGREFGAYIDREGRA